MSILKHFSQWGLATAVACVAISCDDDPVEASGDKKSFEVSFKNLPKLGEGWVYEGWFTIEGQSPVTAGIFTVDDKGKLSKNTFEVDKNFVDNAKDYVLTIEPSPDPDPKPSKVHILGGVVKDGTASLDTKHGLAIKTDFSSVAGQYQIATPTDGPNSNELSGVWFSKLTLPTLAEGWKYEGWAVIDGKPVSTGTFLETDKRDESGKHNGTVAAGPATPGEDFLRNAPEGLTFPTNLQGKPIVISVEPFPDDSPAPFIMKPLKATVGENAKDHTLYDMTKDLSTLPSGTVTIK